MKKIIVFVILLLLVVGGVVGYYVWNGADTEVVKRTVGKTAPKSIAVYRFGNFPESKAKMLADELKRYFPNVEKKETSLELPKEHYNKERNRYYGPGLFDILSGIRGENAVIGLTDYVIFRPNNISETYGIMGVSTMNRYVCVVSNKIPRNGSTQTDENLVKLSLHELGHSFGLPHCPDQHCYMVDAEHRMKLPQSNYFCPKCREFLNNKGWTIK